MDRRHTTDQQELLADLAHSLGQGLSLAERVVRFILLPLFGRASRRVAMLAVL